MISTLLKLLLVIAVITTLGAIIPDAFIAQIDDAIVYFISAQYALQNFINVDVLLACEAIIVGYLVTLGIFVVSVRTFRMFQA